jgi:acetyl-CoA acetyltransferase
VSRNAVLVGAAVARPDELPHAPTSYSIAAQAARWALADAGLGKGDVDGLFTNSDGIDLEYPIVLSQYLGLRPRFVDGTESGGSSWESYVHHAVAAIEQGHCDVALAVYGRAARTEGTGEHWDAYGRLYNRVGPAQFEDVYGPTIPGYYAMAAARHMHEFGTTSEQLAEIAVAMRANAASNPYARFREPITVDDVLDSPLIADPLHRLDCCVVTDGGGAFVLTTEERARDLPRKPIHVLGSAEVVLGWNPAYYEDITDAPAFHTGKAALAKAGIALDDVDVAQIYDSFTITVLLTLEGLGFCGKGEGGAFVEGGRLGADGALPTNTDGGGLSATHPGMRGMFLVVEAARQLWGESTAQVPDARICLCHGTGGYLSSGSTIVLGI